MARPTIKKGMSGKKGTDIGEAILLWRLYLGAPELKPAAGTTVFDFGAATDKATRAWQKQHGLKEDGIVNDSVWAKYDQLIATAPTVVQAKAAAVEIQGEANKAAAMVAAVQGKAAAKPAPKPAAKPTAAPASAPAKAVAAVKDRVVQAKQRVQTVAATVKTKTSGMSLGGRVVTAAGILFAGLVGYKALSPKR